MTEQVYIGYLDDCKSSGVSQIQEEMGRLKQRMEAIETALFGGKGSFANDSKEISGIYIFVPHIGMQGSTKN